jgi:hypothetical protein
MTRKIGRGVSRRGRGLTSHKNACLRHTAASLNFHGGEISLLHLGARIASGDEASAARGVDLNSARGPIRTPSCSTTVAQLQPVERGRLELESPNKLLAIRPRIGGRLRGTRPQILPTVFDKAGQKPTSDGRLHSTLTRHTCHRGTRRLVLSSHVPRVSKLSTQTGTGSPMIAVG